MDGPALPAGAAAEDVERRRTAGRRGKARRRARFLRRARELALRDLGGLVYEARRRERDGGALVEEKVRRLAALDAELRALDAELGAPKGDSVLRRPGVGGTCRRCGELHASDARFCSRCGLDLSAAPEPAPAGGTTGEPQAPVGGDAERPAPAAGERDAPAGATGAPTAEVAASGRTGNGRTTPTAAEKPDRPA